MKSRFDAYELIGVIAPGSVLLFGLAVTFPEIKSLFFQKGFSLGELGLFLIVSFVAGHLTQALGNLIESIVWWAHGGMPTDWLKKQPSRLVDTSQSSRFRRAVLAKFGVDLDTEAPKNWRSIVREMYSVVQALGNTTRIDSFNRTYGLMRGICSSFIVLAICVLIQSWPDWKAPSLLALAAVVAGYRMVRFGKGYGRELAVEYLRVSAPNFESAQNGETTKPKGERRSR